MSNTKPKFSRGDHVMIISTGDDFHITEIIYNTDRSCVHVITKQVYRHTGFAYLLQPGVWVPENNLILFQPNESLDVMEMIGIQEPETA